MTITEVPRTTATPLSVLEAAVGACAGLGTDEVHEWSMTERRRVLHVLDRLTAALGVAKARVLSAEEASGDWALSGAKNAASWRAETTRAGFGAAKGELELANAVKDLPLLGEAIAGGALTLEHGRAVARELSGASPEQRQVFLEDGDLQDRMFRNAHRDDAGAFGKGLKLTMARADPGKFQRDHDAVHARRYAKVWNQAGGVRVEAFLNTYDGRKFAEALNASGRRPGADDDRTPEQCRADALVAMSDAILAYGSGGRSSAEESGTVASSEEETAPPTLPGANRPHLMLTMSMTEMMAWQLRGEFPGAAFDDDTPIPAPQLDALLCDVSVMRVVLDAQGQPVNLGREVRTFHGSTRRALVVRDRGCTWPGCGLAARYAEGHHVRWWSRGGETSIDNGILLCSRHHHAVHEEKMRIVPIAGGFRFEKPDGTLLGIHTFKSGYSVKPGTVVEPGRSARPGRSTPTPNPRNEPPPESRPSSANRRLGPPARSQPRLL